MTKIIVVGGGAGGLELVTKLGRALGRKGKATVTLVDKNRTHLWKPLLHEVATGAMDPGVEGLSYRSQAYNHGFNFQLGTLTGLDREQKAIVLAPIYDDKGKLLLTERTLKYDILVLAIGSVSNDFGTKGVREHCIYLDSPQQAERFHNKMLDLFLHYTNDDTIDDTVDIAIVGGGATGVELSAELYNAVDYLKTYGFKKLGPESLRLTLVEAGPRLLPVLPERIAAMARKELELLGVDVRTETMVVEATSEGLITKNGETIPANLMVWAAGIKAPGFLKDIGGLETNRINQLAVKATLQTTRDDNIYVIGDCAFCLQENGKPVPPRAQSAHQMATRAFTNIKAQLNNKPLKPYIYTDHGSLVNLSNYTTVGLLMGSLSRGTMTVEGRLARTIYVSLYRMHQIALHGYMRTGLMMLVGRMNRYLRPRLKLH
ncbi:NAD(P)/FAD-dependent oxidoreductase [Aliidiomarina quisquiliarum]|uniref:NAD(P)/FAD-dependent oxidoreductase n=1 Tax=Aliidiomarina quisquiliarum TaxID=2938947 RepID=UPI00208E53B2|nr:NAD(P)/FAD-dependent oxidoreductase [Aliidiomarina quisquiliarum]MCO4321364.1 NAD(P)/FAD-dependent oxidoreductase [Aliidiomarina quisquiliarum]